MLLYSVLFIRFCSHRLLTFDDNMSVRGENCGECVCCDARSTSASPKAL